MAKDAQENQPKNPRSFKSFWKHGFKKAIKKSWDKYQWAIVFFPFIYTIIAIVFCKYKWLEAKPWGMDMSTWFSLIIPAIILVIFFGWHFLRAAYEIYKEQFEEHEKQTYRFLEKIKDLESKIDQFYHQTKPLSVSCLVKEMPGGVQGNYEIVLTNENPTHGLDGVELSLIDISPPIEKWNEPQASTAGLTHLEIIKFATFGMTGNWLTGHQSAYFSIFAIIDDNGQRVFQFFGTAEGMPEFIWENFNRFTIHPEKEHIFKFEARARGVFKVEKKFKLTAGTAEESPFCTFEEI
jgi:hypothetical protein